MAIAIRPDLLRRERAEVVGHELIHLERGILEHPDPVMRRREEECVHDELCRRMIPLDELVPWLVARGDEPTTARDVAEWWDRTPALAGRALRLAKHPSQAWRWRAG